MKFIADTIQILADTTWPTARQGWRDFMTVLEYTAFFVVIIYLVDLAVSSGISSLLNINLF